MAVAKKMHEFIKRSSWIRAMFETGIKLKAKFGSENVYDFSLGNPCLEPPIEFKKIIERLIKTTLPGQHAYMPNAGYPAVRASVAQHLKKIHDISFSENEIIMTVGAAGALNIVLKAILDPGAKVVIPTPYFVEYDFYIDNHGGNVVQVPTKDDFTLNIEAIAQAIDDKTCAVLINSPNNPTGTIYSLDQINELGHILTNFTHRQGRIIYLISDEPYRQIVYEDIKVPSIFAAYQHSIVVTSFSKNLNLPGERIGYATVHPKISDKDNLIAAMILANRILGYVNAPGLMQRAIAELLDNTIDINNYAKKRNLICDVLDAAGFSFIKPHGTFYVFPKSPIIDDIAFVHEAQKENLLLVPGSGFMAPGYFRIAFCCPDETIIRSAEAFKRIRRMF